MNFNIPKRKKKKNKYNNRPPTYLHASIFHKIHFSIRTKKVVWLLELMKRTFPNDDNNIVLLEIYFFSFCFMFTMKTNEIIERNQWVMKFLESQQWFDEIFAACKYKT